MYAEQAYFDGVPVQHIAAWQEHNRLREIDRRCRAGGVKAAFAKVRAAGVSV